MSHHSRYEQGIEIKNATRNQLIFYERVFRGKTYGSIGEKYNLTAAMVRLIVYQQYKLGLVGRFLEGKLNRLNQQIATLLLEDPDPAHIPEITPDISTDIDELIMSQRTRNCFKNANIETLEDLCSMTSDELLLLPNFGKMGLREVTSELCKMGLKLKQTGENND